MRGDVARMEEFFLRRVWEEEATCEVQVTRVVIKYAVM
jgi:hypothetical protein